MESIGKVEAYMKIIRANLHSLEYSDEDDASLDWLWHTMSGEEREECQKLCENLNKESKDNGQ